MVESKIYEDMNLKELKKELTANKKKRTSLGRKQAELLKEAREHLDLGEPSMKGLRIIGKTDEYMSNSDEQIQVEKNIRNIEECITKIEGTPEPEKVKGDKIQVPEPEPEPPAEEAPELPEGVELGKLE